MDIHILRISKFWISMFLYPRVMDIHVLWISVFMDIHVLWISMFHGYPCFVDIGALWISMLCGYPRFTDIIILLSMLLFRDIHLDILGFLWISMHWLAMDCRSRVSSPIAFGRWKVRLLTEGALRFHSGERRCDATSIFVKEETKRLTGPWEAASLANTSLEDCQAECVSGATDKFFCRAIHYDENTRVCSLLEEDSFSQGEPQASASPTHHLYDLICLDNSWVLKLTPCCQRDTRSNRRMVLTILPLSKQQHFFSVPF